VDSKFPPLRFFHYDVSQALMDSSSSKKLEWRIARRTLVISERTLVMGVLNITPDSFSDGGKFSSIERALAHAEEMIAEGADIIDIGGESTRPGGAAQVSAEEEMRRVVPVIEQLAKVATVPLSIDTTKAAVARAALDAGAEIVNDISGLRFEPSIADAAAKAQAGLILMHSRGDLTTMHRLEPVPDIMAEVTSSLRQSITEAERRGVSRECIAIDPGIGFSKSLEQNVELIAKIDELAKAFSGFPVLVGTSRKSFLGRLLDGAPVDERLHGTMATVTAAILGGAHIVRVHDVKAAVETMRVADAIRSAAR
jgi:dihydropteroate synthase